MPIWIFSVLVIGILVIAGNGYAYSVNGSLNVFYVLLSVFFATNLFVAYWEVCLHLQKDSITSRIENWEERRASSGKSPGIEILTAVVPWKKLLSPTAIADVWVTYTYYDEGHRSKRSVGLVMDIVNGYVSPIPTLILAVAFVNGFLPPVIAGLLGVMMFWQWIYTSSAYWVSFISAGAHRKISKADTFIWVWSTNFVWIGFPVIGLYVSIELVLSGSYSVLGF